MAKATMLAREGAPLVIELGGGETVTAVGTADFETAFGEFSEFRGRGRARRTARKSARQKKRMTRIGNRMERKSARKLGRQKLKTDKLAMKLARKQMRKDAEPIDNSDLEEEAPMETEASIATSDTQENVASDSNQDVQDSSPNYATEESVGEEEEASDDEGNYGEEVASDEDEGSSFNGEIHNGDDVRIDPMVMDTTRRIVWNEAMINKLKREKSSGADGEEDPVLIGAIQNREERLDELMSYLDDYSEARGGRGAKRSPAVRREFKVARMKAIQEMKAGRQKDSPMPRRRMGGLALGRKRREEFPVEKDLEPEIGANRVEIPAEDNSSFVGDERAPISAGTFLFIFGLGIVTFIGLKKAKVI